MGASDPALGAEARRRATWLDFFLLALLGAFAAYIAYRVDSVLRYNWAWGRVLPYILRADPAGRCCVPGLLLEGLFATIRLSLFAMLLAAPLGLAFGICRTSRSLFLRLVAGSYVGFV